MRLPESFLEELRQRTPLAALVGRRVRLARSGKEHKGCCPFHGEKTPSFYVYDDHFHCFGFGAHGDAIAFVMQTQGLDFREAVEQLAGEAGLDVPRGTPEDAAAERQRAGLREVLVAAQAVFRRRLLGLEGQVARDYLRGRGLSGETIEAWGLGYSGGGRGALVAELGRLGMGPDLLRAAGLLREADGPPAELFFGRVMFPILDPRGRLVSFGGRVIANAEPKYLNGPETEIFAKRRTLFGLDRAHPAVRAGARLLVVEGYLDVLALHQAGFAGAVAPLGTSLTEPHLALLWRLSPAPVLCFDGDKAGLRAAKRSIELALPFLAPDRSLRLLRLPDGQDPDDLVRAGGAEAFAALLGGVHALADDLYALLAAEHAGSEPEARAALKDRLEAVAGTIGHAALAREYRRALLAKFYERPVTRDGVLRDIRGRLAPMIAQRRPSADLLAAARATGRGVLTEAEIEAEVTRLVYWATQRRRTRRGRRAA